MEEATVTPVSVIAQGFQAESSGSCLYEIQVQFTEQKDKIIDPGTFAGVPP